MMKRMDRVMALGLVLTMSVLSFSTSHAASPKAQLDAYVTQLQSSPDDQALREKIIKLARKVKPAIPDDAQKHMDYGEAAVEAAKESKDYSDAVAEFQKAALVAPWLASVYYNLGVLQEKSKDFDGAKKSFKLYLLASPNAKDAKKVKSMINKLDYKGARSKKENEAKVHSLEGDWVENDSVTNGKDIGKRKIYKDDSGSFKVMNEGGETMDATVSGNHIYWRMSIGPTSYWDFTLDLSADGMTLVGRATSNQSANCCNQECVLRRLN
jgi:tetratricopeptide (TPR) repeat protein